jgi:fructose-1,6-bisphosphatase
VNGFTLAPAVSEFLLSHLSIRFPKKNYYYSVNQGKEKFWSRGVQAHPRFFVGSCPLVEKAEEFIRRMD